MSRWSESGEANPSYVAVGSYESMKAMDPSDGKVVRLYAFRNESEQLRRMVGGIFLIVAAHKTNLKKDDVWSVFVRNKIAEESNRRFLKHAHYHELIVNKNKCVCDLSLQTACRLKNQEFLYPCYFCYVKEELKKHPNVDARIETLLTEQNVMLASHVNFLDKYGGPPLTFNGDPESIEMFETSGWPSHYQYQFQPSRLKAYYDSHTIKKMK